ncbi:hypothetical protein LWT80_24770, partial [Enterobacter hormaechei]|uniref:hypothetical protein n=1 Tax=Citrobacter freundii TaxID=546 RepID=UPI00377872C1|nr:hypothetical protein [Enterobacter hormaechei]
VSKLNAAIIMFMILLHFSFTSIFAATWQFFRSPSYLRYSTANISNAQQHSALVQSMAML